MYILVALGDWGEGGIFCDFVIVESYARLKVEEVRETSQGK